MAARERQVRSEPRARAGSQGFASFTRSIQSARGGRTAPSQGRSSRRRSGRAPQPESHTGRARSARELGLKIAGRASQSSAAGRRPQLPGLRRKPQPSRAARVGGGLFAAGKLVSLRLGGRSSGSRAYPGLWLVVGAGAGAAALAARKRRSDPQRAGAARAVEPEVPEDDAVAVEGAAADQEQDAEGDVVLRESGQG